MVVGESTDLLSAFPPNSTPRWHYPWALLNVDMVIVVPAMWRGARQSAGQRVPPGRLPRPYPRRRAVSLSTVLRRHPNAVL
jgi:hypothetical protein